LASGARGLGPYGFHDFPLGFGDARYFSHGTILRITFVIMEGLHQ
jgi:hypothetical protein